MPSSTTAHWLRLSRDYRIVGASSNAPAVITHKIGANLWDTFAGAKEVFLGLYDQAWEHGVASGVVRYAGNISALHIIREDDDTILVAVNYLTVEGLQDVIDVLHDELDAITHQKPRLFLVEAV